jgi:hypothetical protein
MANRVVTVGSGKDYSTLVLAVAGQANVQAGEDNLVFVIDAGYYDPPDIGSCAWVTTTAHRIQFTPATGDFHGFIRTEGVIIRNTADWSTFYSGKDYVEFYGIAFTVTATEGIYAALMVPQSYNLFFGCFVYDVLIAGGILVYDGGTIDYNKYINCVAVNCLDAGFGPHLNTDGATDLLIDNCIILNCGTGIQATGYRTTYVKNTFAGGCTYNYRQSINSQSPTFTNSFSPDGALSSGTLSIANCGFPNSTAGSENILIDSSSDLYGAGADLSADSLYNVTTDAFGTARPSTPTVGPYEPSGGTIITADITEAANALDFQSTDIPRSIRNIWRVNPATRINRQSFLQIKNNGNTDTPAIDFFEGPKTYLESIVEATTSAETQTAILEMIASIVEGTTSIDDPSAVLDLPVSHTETTTAEDSQSAGLVITADITESTVAEDFPDADLFIAADITESTTAEDFPSTLHIMLESVTETAQAEDFQSVSGAIYNVSIEESTMAEDFPTVIQTFVELVEENAQAEDFQSYTSIYPATITEATAALDFQSSVLEIVESVIESAEALDFTDATYIFPVDIEENAQAEDYPSTVIWMPVSHTEAGEALESSSVIAEMVADIHETTTALDNPDAVREIIADILEETIARDFPSTYTTDTVSHEEMAAAMDYCSAFISAIHLSNGLKLSHNFGSTGADFKMSVGGQIVGVPIIAATDDRAGAIRIQIGSTIYALQQA